MSQFESVMKAVSALTIRLEMSSDEEEKARLIQAWKSVMRQRGWSTLMVESAVAAAQQTVARSDT